MNLRNFVYCCYLVRERHRGARVFCCGVFGFSSPFFEMRQRGDTTSEFDTIVAVSSAVESLETSLEAVQTLEKLVKDPNTKDQASNQE